ncbi:hypothetical protein [Adhaeribacter aquaticus]|uniref:hypothetical protein n=1 Tax=Adhaeribacter aquaticus TaxID=299567 RepID=UPI0003FB6E23|nr:hypothetical protein [Adhaeribacter aquaticus]
MKSFLFLLLAVFFAFLTQAQQAKPLVGANIILIKTGETGENAFKKWEKHLEQNGYKIDRSYIDVLTLSTVPKASGNNKFVYLIHTAVTPTGDMAIKLQWQATDNMFTGTKEVDYNNWEHTTTKASPNQVIYQNFLKTAQAFGNYPIEYKKE